MLSASNFQFKPFRRIFGPIALGVFLAMGLCPWLANVLGVWLGFTPSVRVLLQSLAMLLGWLIICWRLMRLNNKPADALEAVALGLCWPQGCPRSIGGLLFCSLLGLGLLWLWAQLFGAFGLLPQGVYPLPQVSQAQVQPVAQTAWAFMLASMGVAPLAEELGFRGVVFALLRQVGLPAWVVITLSSLLFAMLHGALGYEAIGYAFGAGVILGALRHQAGSLWPSVCAHALHNVLVVWGAS